MNKGFQEGVKMDKEQNKEVKNQNDEDVIEMVDELDEEALDTIIRLYDKTIRDLVER